MLRRLAPLLVVVLALAALLAPPAARADTAAGQPVFFAQTGHTMAYSFRSFVERQGGLAIFGYPISEVFVEGGRPVQYFERARLEWHADLMLAQATHLGRWAAAPLVDAGHLAFAPAQPRAGALYFAETRHTLAGSFAAFWQQNGSTATFGYPISEEFVETNAEDGRAYTVQYFERARFELHPELPAPYQVSLGLLGKQHLAAHGAPASALAPVPGPEAAWDGLRPTRLSIARIGVDTVVEEAGFSFGEWDVPRYTAAHYWPVAAFPGTAGNIVVAGHVGYAGIIFNRLPEAQVGDIVEVEVGGGLRRYQVSEILTLLPEDTWVMNPTASETLTLITCIPIGVYSHRLIVRALPLE
jgi:LPXTG-site transpeptidase (sortase) family protein